jgi:hypothetical protein
MHDAPRLRGRIKTRDRLNDQSQLMEELGLHSQFDRAGQLQADTAWQMQKKGMNPNFGGDCVDAKVA